MATLYELSGEYAELIEALDSCDPDDEEIVNHIWTKIEALNDSIADKAEAYAKIMRNKKFEADGYAAEIKRLTEKKRSAESAIERLKVGLMTAMHSANSTEILTGIGKWRIQQNPWSVNILDEEKVPDEFKVPQPPKIDKKGILDRFKATGEEFDGCEFERKESVQFR